MDEEDVLSEHHIADEEDAYWEDDELEQDEELYSDMQQSAPANSAPLNPEDIRANPLERRTQPHRSSRSAKAEAMTVKCGHAI